MTVKVTYQDGQHYTISQQCVYSNQPIILTFIREQQPEEPIVIESTAQILPLTQEVSA